LCKQTPICIWNLRLKESELSYPRWVAKVAAMRLNLIIDLVLWNHRTNLGKAFDSSPGFQLPNGATCTQDAACIFRLLADCAKVFWDNNVNRTFSLVIQSLMGRSLFPFV
jgi:hypothetical protein